VSYGADGPTFLRLSAKSVHKTLQGRVHFFVCHSVAGALSPPAQPGLHLWAAERLWDAALDAGLFNWLIDRSQ
jgi:hypothetical protein